jgi:hypothetical protein
MTKDTVGTLSTLIGANAIDRWYVTDGATSVGPVGLELLGRGIEAGKVPLDGFVRHESWSRWRRMSDLGEADPVFDIRKTIRMGSAVPLVYMPVKEEADGEAASPKAPVAPSSQPNAPVAPSSQPKAPAAPSSQPKAASGAPPSVPRPSPSAPKPASITPPPPQVTASRPPPPVGATSRPPPPPPPVGATSRPPPPPRPAGAHAPMPAPSRPTSIEESAWRAASDLPEAMLLLLADAVKQCNADVALLHDVRPDVAVVVCSHGPRMFESIGSKTPLSDPAITAARSGQTVMAEPGAVAAGRAIRNRLSKAGSTAEGAFMVPLRPNGNLSAFIEIGRASPFRAKDVAAVEGLVDELVKVVESHGWGAEWISDEYIEPD